MLQVVVFMYGFCWLAGFCYGHDSAPFGSGDGNLIDSSLLEMISSSIEMAMVSEFPISSTSSSKSSFSTPSTVICISKSPITSSIFNSNCPSYSSYFITSETINPIVTDSTQVVIGRSSHPLPTNDVSTLKPVDMSLFFVTSSTITWTSPGETSLPYTTFMDSLSHLLTDSLTPSISVTPSYIFSTSSLPVTLSQQPVTTSPTIIPSVLPSYIPMIMVTVLNSTAINVTWSPVPDVSGYIIYVSIVDGPIVKRQIDDKFVSVVHVNDSDVTMYIITGLYPGSNYGIQVASVIRGMKGNVSPYFNVTTNEDIPGPPREVTWFDIGNAQINVSWLPPSSPNGKITSYIIVVNLHSNDSFITYNVSSHLLSIVIPKPSTNDFSIKVSVSNRAGISDFSNATMIFIGDNSMESSLSGGAVAGIVIFCLLFMIIAVILVLLVIFLIWRRYEHGVDDNIGEMEYKTTDTVRFNSVVDTNSEDDGSQLTAKRWMRANANYSTPSVLLPSIAELVSRYSTAEDVVGTKTISRPQVNGLEIISEATSSNVPPQSANSSSERSQEAPSTLSSVCSKGQMEIRKVILPHESELSEREAGMRESELVDGNQPLFEMMENVYVPAVLDESCLQNYLIDSSSLDIKEQIGIGEHTKIFVATNNEEDTVAVKLLKEESIKQDFIGAAYILSQFSHKNILSLLSFTVSPLMMIVTLMELCDLKKYLVRVRRRTRLEHQPCHFSTIDQLNISVQIACGMDYLTSKFYTHKALQSKYVLLDDDFNVKISGFQTSRILSNSEIYQELKKSDKLPMKWFALETLTNDKFTPYTDIWSFGVVLWEIFSFGLTPYRGVLNSDVVNHLLNGERLSKPSDCPDDIYTLMLHCWNVKCRERPSFELLHTHLSNILETSISQREQQDTQQPLNFNIFDFPGVTLLNVDDSNESTQQNDSDTFDHVNSNAEMEMQVVLRNNESSPTITPTNDNGESIRHSDNSAVSSVPELVLSAQPRDSVDIVHSIIGTNNQLLSTEEFTVL